MVGENHVQNVIVSSSSTWCPKRAVITSSLLVSFVFLVLVIPLGVVSNQLTECQKGSVRDTSQTGVS
jgi:hypothetical protein